MATQIKLKFTIPAGAPNGHKLVIPNHGNEIPPNERDATTERKRSDVVIVLREIPHIVFKRNFIVEGKKPTPDPADLLIQIELPLAQALCGVRHMVKYIDGNPLLITSDEILANGDLLVISGKGMPRLGSESDICGDLYVAVRIVNPVVIENKGELWKLLTGMEFEPELKGKYSVMRRL
jgi:DnaJ-class molecular chaperone